jgi:uncharacterized protein YpiB (UPF0302 family)
MSEDKLYELRHDVSTPAGYWRAGMQKTEEGWHKEFGEFRIEWKTEWFIDLDMQQVKNETDPLRELVDAVFERYKLKSLTYKDAAYEIAEQWLKQNQKP